MGAAVADLACPVRWAPGQAFRRSRRPAARHPAAHRSCAAASAAYQQEAGIPATSQATRRDLLLASLVLAGAAACPPPGSQAAEGESAVAAAGAAAAPSSGSASDADDLVTFSNPSQGYSLLRPASWEQVGKAGADSLFRDPEKKSTTVGVTVYPVMIASLEQFGDLPTVAERLLAAERAKESTLSVTMLDQSARSTPSGVQLYDFEYELESTRGRKRVLNTVTISASKLYIVNGNLSCGKGPCDGVEAQLPLLRRATRSLVLD